MKHLTIISLLKTFTKKELNEFERFLRSPYFVEGKGLRHLVLYKYFLLLKDFYPAFDAKSMNKESLYSKLYPLSGYDDRIIRKLNSDLAKLALKFLEQEEFQKDEFRKREYLLMNLSPRKLDRLFFKISDETYSFLEESKLTLPYFMNRQLTDTIVNNFLVYRRELLKRYDFQKEADAFMLYFLSRSLEIYRNMAIDSGIMRFNYKFPFMNEILNFLNENPQILEDNPLIAIHLYELKLNLSNDESNFKKLKDLKNRYSDYLDDHGRYNIYSNLISFCIKMIREGKLNYRRELLENNIETLKKDVFGFMDYISFVHIIVMVRNAAKLKEFTWAKKFVEEYENRIEPKHKEFAAGYSNAEIYFEQGKYDAALRCLVNISIEFSSEMQQAYNLILKIYFETGAYENSLSLIDSRKHVLNNDRHIPDRIRKNNLNFLNHLSGLIHLIISNRKRSINKLLKTVQLTEYYINKDWILKKIQELR